MSDLNIPSDYLSPGRFIDSEHPDIIALAKSLVSNGADDVANAVAIYYWARDSIRYNPYATSSNPADYLASATLAAGEGWCVPKALLLAALCRAASIPARVGYADVRNHLSTERLRQTMQTDVFYFHGYTSLYLQGRWVKATPAFNIELCKKFGLQPLEFDGVQDSLYHEFDTAGNRHMEYLNDRGEYADLPFEDMMAVMHEHYPQAFEATSKGGKAEGTPEEASKRAAEATRWDADVQRETGA